MNKYLHKLNTFFINKHFKPDWTEEAKMHLDISIGNQPIPTITTIKSLIYCHIMQTVSACGIIQ